MALATRCPQCGTAFRLVPDQLRLHDGLVRCGACSAIFDGRQAQFEVDPDTPLGTSPMRRQTPAAPPAPAAAATKLSTIPTVGADTPAAGGQPAVPAHVPSPPVAALPVPPAPHPAAQDDLPDTREPSVPQPAPEAGPVAKPAAAPTPVTRAPVDPLPPAPVSRPATPPAPPVAPTSAPTPTHDIDPDAWAPPLRTRPAAPVAPPVPHAVVPPLPEAEAPSPVEPAPPAAQDAIPDLPLPLSPFGDANLPRAPQPLGEVSPSRREPHLGDDDGELLAPILPGNTPGGVRAQVIDDGHSPSSRAARAEPHMGHENAVWEGDARPDDLPELRRESADTTALHVPPAPPDEVGPVYSWDDTPDTGKELEHVPPEVEGPGVFTSEPPPESAPRRLWPWIVGSVLALLLAGAQGLYLWRDHVATEVPAMRPVLNALCQSLGCSVGYPRHPGQLSIESSSLEPWQSDFNVTESGQVSKRLALRLVLRNRHTAPQPWPSIELTLTNLSDTPVVRRVLAPTDYLPADVASQPMPARSERALRIPVEPPADPVSGYRLSVFFP